MTVAERVCTSCGTGLRPAAKFCDECGAAAASAAPAEYKQVTVLFADVVRSMDLAAAVGPERLRAIMAELVSVSAAVVQRHGGTVDKFTGDGIMALFGAPKALEDHAVRACRAALELQRRTTDLAADVRFRDGIELRLRVGLNSGQVIAGEIGSGPGGYTAIGEQVGMAQRMESAASPGGVLLSESTARLVEQATVLGDRQSVLVKGSDTPVAARQLLAMSNVQPNRVASPFVGRDWEIGALRGLLAHALHGKGSVVNVVGPPGIGKSRIVREVAALAALDGVEVARAYCESHTSDIPFHAATALVRAAVGVQDIPDGEARQRVRAEFAGADHNDLLLVDDLLGIADPAVEQPVIDPDARRRRLTALFNTAAMARSGPVVYVIEDVHWVDEVSEAMLAAFLAVIPRTRSLAVVTYRPEYAGALARTPRSQTITLEPLEDVDIAALVAGVVGEHPSVRPLVTEVAARAGGNPFFAEEIIRDLAEQGALTGQRGHYVRTSASSAIAVPGTLQAVIAARIDRLDTAAKRTLNAAAVIGSRFTPEQLAALDLDPAVEDLVDAELIDQIAFAPSAEYEFRHPLVRAVAYESQLAADRAEWHRRVADTLDKTPFNAALIAEHLEAAAEIRAAYEWHMRAAAWSMNRDIVAAQISWSRAQQMADRLPEDDPDRLPSRIAPRAMLCGTAYRCFRRDVAIDFDEARALCAEAGDKASLALVMSGQAGGIFNEGRVAEASALASEYMALVESLGDPALAGGGMSFAACVSKLQALQTDDVLRWSDAVIALAGNTDDKLTPVIGSPLAAALALRGVSRWASNVPGWQEDFARATGLMSEIDAVSQATVIVYKYIGIPRGVLAADGAALDEIEQALDVAEQSSDDIVLVLLRMAYGLTLVHHGGDRRRHGYQVLAQLRDLCVSNSFALNVVPLFEAYEARSAAESGDRDSAIAALRSIIDDMRSMGNVGNVDVVTSLLIETLLERGTELDRGEVSDLIEAADVDPIFDQTPASKGIQIARWRTLLAHARGDVASYRELKKQYLDLATALNFEGQRLWAEALPEP